MSCSELKLTIEFVTVSTVSVLRLPLLKTPPPELPTSVEFVTVTVAVPSELEL